MLQDFQKQKLLHLFKIIDFDHNGILQKTDLQGLADNIDIFTNVLNKDSNRESLQADIELIWDLVRAFFKDPNMDMIDQNQWFDFIDFHFASDDLRRINSNLDAIVKRVREIFDLNVDQKLSKKEFMTLFVSLRVEVRHANECFEEIDTNKDGFISDSELSRATKQFFSSDKYTDCGNKLFGVLGSSHFSTKNYQLFGQG